MERLIPASPMPVFRPGLALAVPFLLGIAAADVGVFSPGLLAIGIAGSILLLLLSAILRRRWAFWTAVVGAAFLAGAFRMSLRLDLPPNHIARITPPDTGAISLRGIVVTDPVFRRRPSLRPDPPGATTAGTLSFTVTVERLLAPRAPPVVGLVRVSVYEHLPDLRPGDRVVLRGRLRAPRGPSNPGQFDHAARMRRQGIHRVMSVSGAERIKILGTAGGHGFRRAVSRIRRRLLAALGASLRPDAAAFLGAILLGAPNDLAPDVRLAFRRTGTLHYVAISGFHLMMLAGTLLGGFSCLGWRGRSARLTVLAILACYTILTGLKASAVRAFLMVGAVTGADLTGRRRDSLSSLAIAALAIAAVDPAQVFEAGYRLSFLAVFGILWLYPPLRALLATPRDPLRNLAMPTRRRRILAALATYARNGVCVSTAAWLATTPVVATTFHLATPVTGAANLVLCPLVVVELVGATIKAATGLVGGPVDAVTGTALQGIYDLMVLTARGLASFPGAWVPVAGLSTPGAVLYVLVLAAWARVCRVPRPRRALGGIGAAILVIGLARTGPSPPPHPRVATLDVGQGSAHVCESPEGGVVVFDCGSSGYADPGRSVVAPYLWSRGRVAVDLLVLSHPDSDHVNGAPFLMEGLRVGAVAVSPVFDHTAVGGTLLARAAREGIPVLCVSAGCRIEGVPGLVVSVLGPPGGPDPPRLSANNASVIARIRSGTAAVLLPGDAVKRGLAAALERFPAGAWTAGLLVIPHHAGRGTFVPQLARATGARTAVASARTGFASRTALQGYWNEGVEVRGTWEAGAIMAECRPSGWHMIQRIHSWRAP